MTKLQQALELAAEQLVKEIMNGNYTVAEWGAGHNSVFLDVSGAGIRLHLSNRCKTAEHVPLIDNDAILKLQFTKEQQHELYERFAKAKQDVEKERVQKRLAEIEAERKELEGKLNGEVEV